MSSALTPRLSASQQWTDLPADLTTKVMAVFAGQFKIEASHGEFLVEGRIYPMELVVRVGYLEHGRLRQMNFEASIDLSPATEPAAASTLEGESEVMEQSKTMERLFVCIDAIGSVMEEFFASGDEDEMDLPLRWKAYEFEGENVFMQFSTVNTRLEEEADRILGLADKKLFNEELASEDALKNAEIDSELAFEIQKAIRSGRYPQPKN